MTSPALHESAWALAKKNTAAVYGSGSFSIATALISVLTAAIAGLLSFEEDVVKVVLVSLAVGLAGIAVCLAAVFAFQIAAAPLRQRNELRAAWSSPDQLETPEVLVALTDFSRRADDLLSECRVEGYTSTHEQELEKWTQEVVAFLGRHCEAHLAQEFALASKGSETFVVRLEKRLVALNSIAASLDRPGALTSLA